MIPRPGWLFETDWLCDDCSKDISSIPTKRAWYLILGPPAVRHYVVGSYESIMIVWIMDMNEMELNSKYKSQHVSELENSMTASHQARGINQQVVFNNGGCDFHWVLGKTQIKWQQTIYSNSFSSMKFNVYWFKFRWVFVSNGPINKPILVHIWAWRC